MEIHILLGPGHDGAITFRFRWRRMSREFRFYCSGPVINITFLLEIDCVIDWERHDPFRVM